MGSLVTAGRLVVAVGLALSCIGPSGCQRTEEAHEGIESAVIALADSSDQPSSPSDRKPAESGTNQPRLDVAEIQRRIRLRPWQVQILQQEGILQNGVPMAVEAPGGWVQPEGQLTFNVPLSGKSPRNLVVRFLDLTTNQETETHEFIEAPKIDKWGDASVDGFDVTFTPKKNLDKALAHHPVFFRVYMEGRAAQCKEGAFVIQKKDKEPAGSCP